MSRMAHDNLPEELSRLAAKLTDGRVAVNAELAHIGAHVARMGDRSPPIRLAKLRVASPCQERWADMIGDDRVRVCDRCDRPVFDLSAMTRAQAEAVLGTHGIKPCVRFYRRADGTVKTADCPSDRPEPRAGAAAAVLAAGAAVMTGGAAHADTSDDTAVDQPANHQAKPDEDFEMGDPIVMGEPVEGDPEPRPTVEVSTWLGLGYGEASHASHIVARAITPPPASERSEAWEAAAGADLSLPVARDGNLRVGAWAEARTSSGPVLGVELLVEALPRRLSSGDGMFALRLGGNADAVTAALAYGYHAPWSYDHPHYTTGLRVVTAVTRSLDDSRNWTVTAGLEVEPLGALRYVMSWF